MNKINNLPLPVVDEHSNYFYCNDIVNSLCDDIEKFLSDSNFINTPKFTKAMLFPYEIKFNNSIEGYNEDILSIMEIFNDPHNEDIKTKAEYQRIKNLICGYKYILKKPLINEDNLKKLYDLLSNNLLEKADIIPPDDYYRIRDVYIYFSNRVDREPDKGARPECLEEYMKILFDYIDTGLDMGNSSLEFIKSQIIHYYFVYLHPYYDVNGRTSRTLSLWYLNMHNANAFTLFNRGIQYTKNDYYDLIRYTKKSYNLTAFLIYMLKSVKRELQKEYIINNIEDAVDGSLSFIERQTLQYIMENKVNTYIDFVSFYKRFNVFKKQSEIYDEMLLPLLEKKIIISTRKTNKIFRDGDSNFCYEINREMADESILRK